MHAALAIEEGEAPEVFDALRDVERSDRLDEQERAALAWVGEIARSGGAGEASLPELRRHFDDRQIVALSWLAAFITYLNVLAKSLGLSSQGICAVAIARRPR
jgi:alkylhydroperoxidase family enzyme